MSQSLAPQRYAFPADGIDAVLAVEKIILSCPQGDLKGEHFLHAGLYSRTITIPKGNILTGAMIKIATVLIISGDLQFWTGHEWKRLKGYHVIPAEKNRKQLGYAQEETFATMLFASAAKNVKDAEKEFTEDYARLIPAREV